VAERVDLREQGHTGVRFVRECLAEPAKSLWGLGLECLNESLIVLQGTAEVIGPGDIEECLQYKANSPPAECPESTRNPSVRYVRSMVGMSSVDKKRLKLPAPPPPTHASGQSVGEKSLGMNAVRLTNDDLSIRTRSRKTNQQQR
jgi:hypothetical protein